MERLPELTSNTTHLPHPQATVIRQQRTNKLITRARLVRTINPRKRPEANLTFKLSHVRDLFSERTLENWQVLTTLFVGHQSIPIVLAAAKRYVSV
jgi:hypothetical protein